MDIRDISRHRYSHTMLWAVLLSSLVIAIAATLGRAVANVKAALIDKPDIAVYLLLKDEGITHSVLLRSSAGQRDYLVQTKTGSKVVKLKMGEKEWYVSNIDTMHE